MADVTDRMLLLLLQIFVLVSTLLCHPVTGEEYIRGNYNSMFKLAKDGLVINIIIMVVFMPDLCYFTIVACSDGSLGLLLVSTDSPLEGDLAICMGGQWGKVRSCPSPGFPGSAEAVACTQLGLSPTSKNPAHCQKSLNYISVLYHSALIFCIIYPV